MLQNGLPAYVNVVMVGDSLMVMLVVVLSAAHPPEASVLYVTVYVPGVLPAGVMPPVEELMIKPGVDENIPPVKLPVPPIVTG